MLKVEVIPVTRLRQNCSLLWDDSTMRGALVDAGGDIELLLERARIHGVQLEKLLVTHPHVDHASGVAEIAERLGLPIEGPHRDDQYWIDQLLAGAPRYGFPPGRSFVPDRWLEQGDRTTVGSLAFEVLHCPGHTPGHVVFHQAAAQFAFVGDVLFRGSVGRSDLPGGSHSQLLASIRERLFPLGDDVRFVPGHGPLSTFGAERLHNPFVGLAADSSVQRG
jgi:glyoxylase-like metal-dependent hydrolase (beta-lactamase superfamily II)